MKRILLLLACGISQLLPAQTYLKHNIDLISLIAPNKDTLKKPGDNQYSGCWGWHQTSKNKEYAISGTSNGTYFIDVTVPASPSVSAFVPGKAGGTWREMKTYQNYCYIISDDAAPNKFTIVDMQYLPDSVHIVHSGKKYFERGHTIFIEQDKMYIGGTTYSVGSSPMTVWSLATPTAPVLLRRLEQDFMPSIIEYVHDMFVRNDTVYASAGYLGLFMLRLEPNNTFTYLGSYSGYQDFGYNHSSWLTQNGKYLVFCDENAERPVHLVDVQNPGNIQEVSRFKPTEPGLSHNPYIIGNKIAVVSSYQDGLYVYDISNPQTVSLSGFFDTYPQGGVNTGTYPGHIYSGNWGAYPYLPSGIIIANDMQNGVFILNPNAAYTTSVTNPVGITTQQSHNSNLILYPNPSTDFVAINYQARSNAELEILDILGAVVLTKKFVKSLNERVDIRHLTEGSYIVCITEEGKKTSKKLIIHH